MAGKGFSADPERTSGGSDHSERTRKLYDRMEQFQRTLDEKEEECAAKRQKYLTMMKEKKQK